MIEFNRRETETFTQFVANFLRVLYEIFGTRKINPVDLKEKENSKPIFSQPYPVQKLHKEVFKKEVGRLVLLEVIENQNDSEWGAPSFVNCKPKTN